MAGTNPILRARGEAAALRPRILFVGKTLPDRGGAGRWADPLLRGLAGLGYDLHVLTAAAPGDPPILPEGIPVATFPVPYRCGNPGNWARAYRAVQSREVALRLPALVDRLRPDLLIVGSESMLAPVAGALRRRHVRLLSVIHGSVLQIHMPEFPPDAAQELLGALRRSQEVVAVARHMLAPLATLCSCPLTAVPNGVDLGHFVPRPADPAMREAWAIPADSVVVGHLSNFKPVKRLPDLVAAAQSALAQDRRLVFLFIGDGPEAGRIRDLCRRAGILERCRFPGWVPHERVPDALALCDMVAMPSASEALALAYLEAQAAERPLIASDIPAAREVIVEGRTGLLHPLGDTGVLADRILTAAADPDLRRRLGREARRHVARHHAVPDMVARYAALIERMTRGAAACRTG